jgi:hypothetical protein
MNETLEQIAKALFKSWFVDFDPVHAKAAGRQPTGMDKATAQKLVDAAHQVCPYSNATRGNIEVTITLV